MVAALFRAAGALAILAACSMSPAHWQEKGLGPLTVGWGPYAIPPGGPVYFTLPVPPAPTYEVSIFAWTWVLDDDWGEFDLR